MQSFCLSALGTALTALLPFFAASQAVAAPFTLPEHSAIEIRAFAFPPGRDADVTEGGLPENFHDRLVVSLQRAGFTVGQAPALLEITPLRATDQSMPEQPAPEDAAVVEEAASVKAVESEESAPEETAPEEAAEAGQDVAEEAAPEETAEAEQSAETAPQPRYILTGRVTLLKENVGAPTRIAGGIRIRTEASMHCAYRIEEAATGKVMITDAISVSAGSVTSETRDIDAALAKLTDRVLTVSAAKIASRLSGVTEAEVTVGNEDGGDDREEYQDSPGKRLKPKSGRSGGL